MNITIEYLAIFPESGTFCDSAERFVRLLNVDSIICVRADDISFDGHKTCKFQISDGEVPTNKQRYFHLHFTWSGNPDVDADSIKRFTTLLKTVRTVIQNARGKTEILWDELSAYYALKAYPLIHEIENLMRRLIANFMFVTVGKDWIDETLPKPVEDAVKKSKRKDSSNILDTVDFIHLGELLFTPYSKRTLHDLYDKLKEAKTEDDIKSLADFIPESNWKRYFKKIVTCEDGYLKSRWDNLYELRCKVAHNALMTKTDLDEIEKLIGEVKPKLLEAINKLSKVKVPAEDIEIVAENATRTINALMGEFISCWQQLQYEIQRCIPAKDKSTNRVYSGDALIELGVLNHTQSKQYDEFRRFRNILVHGRGGEIPEELIKETLSKLQKLLTWVSKTGYLKYLRALSNKERRAIISDKISDTILEITDSDEFNNTTADSDSSSFTIEYSIIEINFTEIECIVKISFVVSGDRSEGEESSEGRIIGDCEVAIAPDSSVEYRDIHTEVDNN
jgi:hypothetical protein